MAKTASSRTLLRGHTGSIPLDDAFLTLADRERRQLLVDLRQREEYVRLPHLARSLSVEGNSEDTSAEQIHLRLHHVHVPKLADVGIVTHDEDRGTVALTDDGQAIADALLGEVSTGTQPS